MKKRILLLFLIFTAVFVFRLVSRVPNIDGEGTYAQPGTANEDNSSPDGVSWASAMPIMVDAYGNYIVPILPNTGTGYAFIYSNDNGSTWFEDRESALTLRTSAVYDSINDKIHAISANSSNGSVVYRRYIIRRDKNYNITGFDLDSAAFSSLTLDSQGACTSASADFPIILFKDDGVKGKIVTFWSITKTCSGTTVTENRASMRTLTNTSADGTASNWAALDGTSDASGATGPAAVDYNLLYGISGSAVTPSAVFQQAAFIRGGSGNKSSDIYYFNVNNTPAHQFMRLSWNSGSGNWSGTWTSASVFGGNITNSSGYGRKDELISKPVYDPDNDRVYIGFARWIDETNGDTQSLAYVDSSDNVTVAGNVYSHGGTAWFAPTLDIAYNSDDNKLYYFFQTSDLNPNTGATDTAFNGKAYYKTYDGSSFSNASAFFTLSGYTIDIPVVYQSPVDDRLLFFFRADGAEGPYTPPHFFYWGYLSSGGTTLTGTVTGSNGTYSATTYSDFDKSCASYSSTEITNLSGGEIALESSFRDDFETPRSPYTRLWGDLWTSGVWSAGTFDPTPDGTVLIYNSAGGAYILGNTAFNKKTLEFSAKFTDHNFQHIGWADGTGFNQYVIFSTSNNGQLNARVNNGGGEESTQLGTSYYGAYHNYKITWADSDIKFYIDGSQVATSTTNVTQNLKVIGSNNTTTSGSDLTLDWVNVVNYPTTSGTYTTCAIDSGTEGAVWGTLTFTSTTSANTSATIKSRTSTDNSTWTSWSSAITSGDNISSSNGRYLQLLLSIGGTSSETGSVNDFTVNFTSPTPTSTPTPTATPVPSASSGSATSVSAVSFACHDVDPGEAPSLYSAIPVNSNSVKLFFTDAKEPYSKYVIAYGIEPGTYKYGSGDFGGKGTRTYTVEGLDANTTYYFRVAPKNGCQLGKWSNELSVKTLGKAPLFFNNNNFISSTKLEKSVAETVESNKPETTSNKTEEKKGVSFEVKVVNDKNEPVEGAVVELHSKVRTAKTDKNGLAKFNDVEAGQHRLVIFYDNQKGEQSIYIDNKKTRVDLTVQVKTENKLPIYLIGAAIGAILTLAFLLIFKFKYKLRSTHAG